MVTDAVKQNQEQKLMQTNTVNTFYFVVEIFSSASKLTKKFDMKIFLCCCYM